MTEQRIATVVSRDVLQANREPAVVFIEDAFTSGAAYVRGYHADELDRWRTAAARLGGDKQAGRGAWLARLQFAACVLQGPAPELIADPSTGSGDDDEAVTVAVIESMDLLTPLYGATTDDLKALAHDVPPGSLDRLVAASDALVGYRTGEAEAIKSYPRVRAAKAGSSGSSSAGGASTDSDDDPGSSTG